MHAIDDHSGKPQRQVRSASPGCRFLLFAGQDQTPGGLRDFVALYEDEAAARRAFAAIRLSSERRAAWAELGSVDPAGKVSVLCWFGHDRPAPASASAASRLFRPAPGATADGPRSPARRRPFWRRRAQGPTVAGQGLVV